MKLFTILLTSATALFCSSCACTKGGSCCASGTTATKTSSGCKTCDMGAKKGAAKDDMKAM